MTGLRKICKAYGSMTINGVRMVWDYVTDDAVPESEMPVGSDRHRKSEHARWLQIAVRNSTRNSRRQHG